MNILDRVKKIRIGGMDLEVRENPEMSIAAGVCGRISMNLSRIEIEPNLSQQHQAQTLLHEVLHGVINVAKLGGIFATEDDEERCIDGIAYGLLQVIRDNPDLVDAIRDLWDEDGAAVPKVPNGPPPQNGKRAVEKTYGIGGKDENPYVLPIDGHAILSRSEIIPPAYAPFPCPFPGGTSAPCGYHEA